MIQLPRVRWRLAAQAHRPERKRSVPRLDDCCCSSLWWLVCVVRACAWGGRRVRACACVGVGGCVWVGVVCVWEGRGGRRRGRVGRGMADRCRYWRAHVKSVCSQSLTRTLLVHDPQREPVAMLLPTGVANTWQGTTAWQRRHVSHVPGVRQQLYEMRRDN